MVRVRSVLSAKRRKKRVLKAAKGQFGSRSRDYKQAAKSVMKGMAYAFCDRRNNKRAYRSLWIVRINAACKENGITYSAFMKGLSNANVGLDRKLIADMAVNSPAAFDELIKVAKEAKLVKKAKNPATTKKAQAAVKKVRTAKTKVAA
jgi:large subunit ribosomal protein L20